ncbi:malonate transporter subunit MadL, partial [Brevibacterium paucivorans]
MILYGVAALAASVLAGTIIGEILGQLLGVDANVGGVGFGMILLIALTTWLRSKGKL